MLKDTQVKSIIVTRIGDLLRFPKSTLVNFVVKHIKKMVPAYELPDVIDFKRTLQVGARHTLQPVDIDLMDIAFIQYTAGTTGVAKGVLLSHGNIVANIQQTSAWVAPFTEEGRLEHGFLRVRCETCHAEHLVAFNRKRCGFCPRVPHCWWMRCFPSSRYASGC